MELGRTGWAASALALAIALVACPVAATAPSQDAYQEPSPDAPYAVPEAPGSPQEAAAMARGALGPAWAALQGVGDALGPAESPQEENDGSGSQGGSDPASNGGQGSGSGSGGGSSPSPRPTRPGVPRDVSAKVEAILRPVQDALPADPVSTVLTKAHEAADRARSLPSTLLPGAESSSEPEPEPQSSGPEAVQPSLLTPTLILAASAAAATATFLGFWLAGSSGAVGSPAAAAAARRVADLRRLLPFASPLFTRFERDTVLGHPRREALYALILQEPGISLQSLGEATGLSRTAVIHHLRLLEQQHLVVSRRVGRSRHYFENGGRYGHDQKEAYAILQNGRSKAVADFIKSHPGSMQKTLCEALGIQPSIAHWHVRRLEDAGIVETVRQGRKVAYFPGRGLPVMAPLPEAPAAPAQPAPSPTA